ncbi:TolC family protein [Synechococcus sp. H55.5]|uniref:TolC family protein n=2 Tax=Synechococcus TaxID=1129 RepID=UPI0039C0E1CB
MENVAGDPLRLPQGQMGLAGSQLHLARSAPCGLLLSLLWVAPALAQPEAPGSATFALPNSREILTPPPPPTLSIPPNLADSAPAADLAVQGALTAEELVVPQSPLQVRIERREGLSLEQALELAVAQNPTVQQARLAVERAEAGVAVAQAAFAPSLSTRASYQYSEPPSPGGGPSREVHTFSASVVRVEYTAFDTGLREQNLKLAQEALRVAQLQLEQALQTVKQAVANAYYDLQSADARVAIRQAAVESSEATLRDAQARERAGLGTRFEILQAETELANNRQALLAAQNIQQLNRRRLAELLNFPSPTDVLASDRIEPMGEWDLSLEETIIAAFAQRQELERQRRELEQAQSRVRLAQARNGPQVGLFATLDAVNDFNASRNSFDVGYSVGANFSLTWFDGGAASAQARQAQIDGQVAVSNFVGTRNEIQRGVEEAFLTLSSSREQIDSAKVAIASAEESLRLARLRLQAGVGTQTEVINAEAALTTARGNLSDAVIAYNRALVQLRRAIGSL